MMIKVRHLEWQLFRAIKRAGNRPVVGRSLRLDMSRRTKDGTFLTELVDQGFLTVAEKHDNPFEAKYRLTELGQHVAEYGEYDKPMPNPINRTKDESEKWFAERSAESEKQTGKAKKKK